MVTYDKWIYKSNPKFPTPEKVGRGMIQFMRREWTVEVRDEIVQMLKGMLCASLCPAISVELAKHGYSQVNVTLCLDLDDICKLTIKAFCGMGGYSVTYHVFTFILTWIASDLFEFAYHLLGHSDIRWVSKNIHLANVYFFSYYELRAWALSSNQISLWRLFSQINIRGPLFINLDLLQIKSSINW